jgi:hypothetical protein
MTTINFRKAITLLAAVLALNTVHAQDSKTDREKEKAVKVQNIINANNFVFVAESALPMGGRTIYLTSPYNVRVSNDTLLADLPYYGRAYSAPINPSEGGIRFTSTNFDYKVKDRKKSGWDILITPKDTRDVRQLFLTASENGYASLQVTSNNRQAITFTGYIKELKK